ncbi:acylphosphatase [Alteribacter natronophilus]|uniref:acylphosphatase n=1 Tax=Alteribacter natronophilus TaxID=2583810 RepID=UPI00110E651A|nr:acylphosphatase [Alteribacter natronophilus]TMW70625.1 acylphosphatase [Alteribacter natronophilus]
MKRVQGIVHGKVQGVGFRHFTKVTAAEHDIKGWVRNLSDGTVEFEAEGPESSIRRFIEDIKKGQRPAKVESVETNDIQPLKSETRFRQRKTR